MIYWANKLFRIWVVILLICSFIPMGIVQAYTQSAVGIADTPNLNNDMNTKQLVITQNGTLSCAYSYGTGGTYSIKHGLSYDNGSTWTTSVVVSDASHILYDPSMCVDGMDNIHMTYMVDYPMNIDLLYYTKFTWSAQTWSAPLLLATDLDIGQLDESSIAVDSMNNLHVVYSNNTGGAADSKLQYFKYTNATSTWGSSVDLTIKADGCYYPTICVDSSDTIHVSWENYTGGWDIIMYMNYSSGTWQTNYSITTVVACTHPDLVYTPDGVVHLVYRNNTGNDVSYQQFVGGVWSLPEQACTNRGWEPCIVPRIDGSITVLWRNNTDHTIRCNNRSAVGAWGGEVQLLSSAGNFHTIRPVGAFYPVFSGTRTNILCDGFCFVYYSASNQYTYFYKTDDLAWNGYPLSVTSNNPTGMTTRSCTLNATLNGGVDVNAGFRYGLTPSMATNSSPVGTYTFLGYPTLFINGLSKGSYYFSQGWARNFTIFTNSSTKNFITIPESPSNISSVVNPTNVSINWTNTSLGTGVHMNTTIRYKTSGYPTSYSDGTLLYNGTVLYHNMTTTPNVTYYFRAWTYCENNSVFRYSSNYTSYAMWVPASPYNIQSPWFNDTRIQMTWTKGNNSTVIVRNETTYPPTPYNGTEVYNGTAQTFTDTGLTPQKRYYYRAWNWNGTSFSTQYSNFTLMTEPSPPTGLNYFIMSGYNFINISWTKGNNASRTLIQRSDTSQPLTISDGTNIYNDTGTYYNMSGFTKAYYFTLFSYNNTNNMHSNHSAVNLTAYLVFINCYNESNGNAISGFNVFITNQSGTETYVRSGCTNPALINITDIPKDDDVSIIVNATGYYQRIFMSDITPTSILTINCYLAYAPTSYAYLIQVLDYGLSFPLSDASVVIKRYVNATTGYATVTSTLTDDSGEISVFLEPNIDHIVLISADGYDTDSSHWIPTTTVFTKTFKLVPTVTIPPSEVITDCVFFNGNVSGTTLYLNYTDVLLKTLTTQITIYEINGSNASDISVFGYDNQTGNSSFMVTVAGINTSNTYKCVLTLDHTTFGDQLFTWYYYGVPYIFPVADSDWMEGLWVYNFGTNPIGWTNTLGWFGILAIMFSFGRKSSFISMLLVGILLLFLNMVIGFGGAFDTIAGTGIPVLMILLGGLMAWRDYRRERGVL